MREGGLTAEEIQAKVPYWQKTHGFSELTLEIENDEFQLSGAMSAKRPPLHSTVVLLAGTHFIVDGYSNVYAPLLHAPWHGWTPTDLIFPFFLFIVGVSITLSTERASRCVSNELPSITAPMKLEKSETSPIRSSATSRRRACRSRSNSSLELCLTVVLTASADYERSPICLRIVMKSKLFQASTIFPLSIRTIAMPVNSTGD